MIVTTDVDTPVGPVRIAARGKVVVACGFVDRWGGLGVSLRHRFPHDRIEPGPSGPGEALHRYVAGDVGALDDLETDTGGTAFQRRVWAALRTIPTGSTWSYTELAAAAGSDSATRAVGSANGANPVSLVVPCHRVIRADGALGGYGGGIERKAWLLAHEGARLA